MASLYSIGRPNDPHITRVHGFLREAGVEAVLVPSWSPDPLSFLRASWTLDAGWSFPPDMAFWLRNKHRVGAITSSQKQDEWWSFASTMEFFRVAADHGVLSFNGSKHPAATDSKIAQLEAARQCGFDIPATLVSNDRDRILAFVEQFAPCIIKPFTQTANQPINGDATTARFLPTMPLTADTVRQASDESFRVAPGIFQAMIDKAHELRVVAFGDEIVSFRIDSQERSFTRMDWRAGEPLLACPVVETPTLIREPIAAFLALSGLHSSVFDFAVTPEGRTVFFESNPAGQWANMDGLNDYVVSRMFARQMARCIQAAPARPATSSPPLNAKAA